MNMASFPMPYATIVDFSRSMNCSKTKVLGVHGTVKEVYGLDDWKINIRGFCIADKSREEMCIRDRDYTARQSRVSKVRLPRIPPVNLPAGHKRGQMCRKRYTYNAVSYTHLQYENEGALKWFLCYCFNENEKTNEIDIAYREILIID